MGTRRFPERFTIATDRDQRIGDVDGLCLLQGRFVQVPSRAAQWSLGIDSEMNLAVGLQNPCKGLQP
jgi:hypothetical protein